MAFESIQADDIVLNAGGCGALLVEYDHLLKEEPNGKKEQRLFLPKSKIFQRFYCSSSLWKNKSYRFQVKLLRIKTRVI